ncbi:MAG: DUF4281 domain-containing protein [Rhizobiales bacterium]|nr:DUF4281 domain-containing protein [Hyphomicrobiales bacterium]
MIFQVANFAALAGWIVLGLSVILRRERWRDRIAGRAIPLALSALYLVLIAFFFARAEGGFDSLGNVQKLFTYPWAALAGWVHYLAFDLFVGAWIARQSALEQLPRWPLAIILPLTFLFGPIGLIAFIASRQLLRRPSTTAV